MILFSEYIPSSEFEMLNPSIYHTYMVDWLSKKLVLYMDESHLNYTDFTHNRQIEHPFHTPERKFKIPLITRSTAE